MQTKLLIMGKSNSGKSYFEKKLEEAGLKKILPYTTRPDREEEKDKKDYHHISDEDFLKKESEGFFVETASYDTIYGKWYYGSALEDYYSGDFIVLPPANIKKVAEALREKGIDCKIVLLYAMQTVRFGRAINRGDDVEEVLRRMETDNEDFKNAPEHDISFNTSVWTNEDIDKAIKKLTSQ